MRHRLVRVIALLMFVGTASAAAFGWGADGHRAIALRAQERLSAHASAEVRRILGTEPMERASTWPDELRKPGRTEDEGEARQFNEQFPGNRTWHYLNMPLGSGTYNPQAVGARTDDPVQVMKACISTLQGHKPDGYTYMSEKQALKWLVHLVGDIHQPMHVGSGYYAQAQDSDRWDLVSDPQLVEGLRNDKGGNDMQLVGERRGGDEGRTNLHKYWDTNVVRKIGHDSSEVVASLDSGAFQPDFWEKVQVGSATLAQTTPESWATDTLGVAARAYSRLGQTTFEQDGNNWVARPDLREYEEWGSRVAALQLHKASMHLAATLNALWP